MPIMKEQIIELLKQGRKLEAVATAHRLGGGTLQQAKRYVDAVERETLNGNLPDDNDRVVRSWSVKYNGGKPVSITLRDQYGERQLVEGTLEWNAIQRQKERISRGASRGGENAIKSAWPTPIRPLLPNGSSICSLVWLSCCFLVLSPF